jgi:hypothetical protein
MEKILVCYVGIAYLILARRMQYSSSRTKVVDEIDEGLR